MPKLVNSWTEWAPLEEIVIGRADDICFEPVEPAFKTEFGDPTLRSRLDWPEGRWSKQYVQQANEELELLCSTLQAEGVTVKRPKKVKSYLRSEVPDGESSWSVNTQYGELYARDIMATIGNVILEATTSRRGRFFEYLPYREIARDLWRQDRDSLWKACPKPSMATAMYNTEFWEYTEQKLIENEGKYDLVLNEKEPAFDVADIMRVGRDVFVQRSLVTNYSAIEWLRRELAGTVTVHSAHFPWDHYPEHIDVTMVPLRPPTAGSEGIVLVNEERPPLKSESDIWYANDWKFLVAPEPIIQDEPLTFDGDKWIATMNTLSMSEKLILIEENETRLERFLDDLGIDVIKLPFRGVNVFGGSFHCVSWDVRRRDSNVDYYPSKVETDEATKDLVKVIDTENAKYVKNPSPNQYKRFHSPRTLE